MASCGGGGGSSIKSLQAHLMGRGDLPATTSTSSFFMENQQQQQQQQQLQEEQWQQWSANQPPPPLSLLQRSLDISNMQQQQQQQPQLHLNHLLENNGGWTLAEMDKHTVGTNITSAPAEFDAAWNHNHSHQQHQQPLNLQQLQHTAAPPPPGLIHDRPDAADAGEEDKWMIDAFIKTQQDLKASTRHIPPFFTPPPLQLNQFKRMLLDSDGRNPSVNTQLLDQAVQMRQDQTDWAAQFKQQLQLFNDEDVTQQQQHAPTTTNDTPDQPIHIDAASEQDALAKTAATLAHIMNNVDGSSSTSSSPSLLLSNSNNISNSSSAVSSTNATEAKFKQSKFLQFMKELGSGAVIVKDGKVVPNDSATGTTAYINNNPVTCNEQPIQAFEAAKQFLGDSSSSTASWEEDFNLDSHQHDLPQRRGAEWVHEFASAGMSDATATTTNHHTLHPQQQQPASSTNAGDWATQFQLQQQEYIDPLHDPSEIEWEVDISNSSGDEHEYPFLPSNPYSGLIRTPRQALDRLASCTSIAESILVLEAGAITSDHTRSQLDDMKEKMDLWLKLGEALQANADDERAIVALSHVTHHPYTRFLTGNDNQRIFEEIISSARLALASSFANSPNNDTYMSRELYTWLEKHPLYAHIVESWKTKMRSEIESFPSFITPNPDELVQLYIRAANLQRGDGMGGVDAQVQNALGILMFSSGKYDHAADCFQLVATHTQRTPLSSSSSSSTVAAADARSQLAWSRLGAALTNADQHEQAMSAYQTISSLSPVLSLRTAFNMAVLHVRADRHEDAMKLLLDSLMASRQEMKRLGVKNNDASDRGALLIRGEDDVWGLVDSIASVYCKSLVQRPEWKEAISKRNLGSLVNLIQ